MSTPLLAMKAYQAAQAGAATGAGGAASPVDSGGFAELVRDAIAQTAQSTRAAETQMAAQVQGRAELIDVVTAVASAEASLEMVVAIRDQAIQAYQEIMRMPI